MARKPSDRDRRGGPPVAWLGVAALVALVAAYLGDCLPGLGAGGSLGAPHSESPAPAKDSPSPVEVEGESRVTIVVTGKRCRVGSAEPELCASACASFEPSAEGKTIVEVDAIEGTHGAVEALRRCLADAGFTDIRVRSE